MTDLPEILDDIARRGWTLTIEPRPRAAYPTFVHLKTDEGWCFAMDIDCDEATEPHPIGNAICWAYAKLLPTVKAEAPQ